MILTAICAAALVTMTPDCTELTVPPNIAPLNFDLDREAEVELSGPDGAVLSRHGREIRFAIPEWRAFLEKCRGKSYTISVRPTDGADVLVSTNSVSGDEIDGYLTYRLLAPSYIGFDAMGIYQRDLASFVEKPLYRNVQTARNQCVNCHTYKNGDPETFLFHRRIVGSGTVIAHPKYGLGLHQIKPERGYAGGGVYPAWHPSGEFVVFSVNETRQMFHLSDPQMIEVADLQSDLVLYSLADSKTITVECSPQEFECFPTWSPDGSTLYTSRALINFPLADSDAERVARTYANIRNLRYDIVARSFDPQTRTFSPPKVVLDAQKANASFLFPRVSPDGRWMVVTLSSFGVFPIWHREADLWLLDLSSGTFRRLDEINSNDTDSYHCFSSDGKWMVFSSRRIDGTYTRPYFTHFDAESGRFSKPILIPTEEPSEHVRRFRSYNIPEFSTGPVKYSPRELREAGK